MSAASKSAGAKKEVAELEKAIRKSGYKLVPSGGGHKKVVDQRGRPVVDRNGPLIVSSSPSEARWREMHVSRLMNAGVLKEDPWNPEERPRRQGLQDPAVKEKAHIALQREMARREQETKKIRERIEPLVVKLGGWEKHGFVADLGRVMYHVVKARGRVEAPKNQAAAVANARNLKLGGTLSDSNAICWNLLLDDLEQAQLSGPTGLRDRWVELCREAKGVNRVPSTLPPELPGLNGVEPEPPTPLQLAPAPAAIVVPRLALEAAARMGKGVTTDAEMNEVIVLAEKFAQLEIQTGGS